MGLIRTRRMLTIPTRQIQAIYPILMTTAPMAQMGLIHIHILPIARPT